jgi:hypothetical protein
MLAILLYRRKILAKDPTDMTQTQRTVFLIAAEQSKIYFLRTEFSVSYIQEILALEDLARTMLTENERSANDHEDCDQEKQVPDHEGNDCNDDQDLNQKEEKPGPRLEIYETMPLNLERCEERKRAAGVVLKMLINIEAEWDMGDNLATFLG